MNSHRIFAPVMLALSLAFSTAATAQAQAPTTPVPAETPHHHRTRAEWDTVMQQRMAMMNALEVTHDDAALAALLKDDKNLENYGTLLLRTAGYLHDPRLLEKLLDFPTLDKSSPEYIRAVSAIFAEIAANGPKPEEAKLATMMFERVKNDKATVNDVLRFLFETSAMFNGDHGPDIELTRLLIASGGDIDGAVANVKKEILSNKHPLMLGFPDERLARVEKFRVAVTAPVNPQPAPQNFVPKG